MTVEEEMQKCIVEILLVMISNAVLICHKGADLVPLFQKSVNQDIWFLTKCNAAVLAAIQIAETY